MTEHLPALQVVIPLLIAPVIFLLNHARTAWLAGVAVSWVSLIISILLLMQVMDGGPVQYEFGGWEPPWGMDMMSDEARLELGFM